LIEKLRTRILVFFIVWTSAFAGKAYAGAVSWTGGSSINWSDAGNWSSGKTPTNGDDVTISGGTTFAPLVDIAFSIKSLTVTSTVTLTLSAALKVNKTLLVSGGTLTLAGTNSATFGGTGTINNTCALTTGTNTTTTFNGLLSVLAGSALTNNGTLDINAGLTAAGYPSPINNTGTITVSGSALTVAAGGSITNTGIITTNSGSTVALTGNPAPINNNLGGIFTSASTTFTMAAGSSITNTGGTFAASSSTITCNGNPTAILNQNSGSTTGLFTLNGTSVSFNGTNTITNYGLFTANSGTAITTTSSANSCSITNYGTFYAGTSNSSCTITYGLGSILSISNSSTTVGGTTYNGTLFLGSTSIIYPSVANSSITNSTNCTFTLQSDIYGSASIGALSGTITGLYNVQRYLRGGSSTYRSYRELSSPVYETTVSGNNVYSINYLKLSALLTGSGGTAGGFDKTGNPSLYLYRDNTPFSNATFTGGNFRSLANISADPSYTIDNDGSGFNIPVGNGFLFFDRGDRTTNLTGKYTPGTSAESITLTANGTMNTGKITVKLWFTPSSSNLDYTAVTGNAAVLGFALVGNPYASSIDWDTYSTSTSTAGVYAPNVSKFIYILDPVSKNYSVYGAGNGGVGTIAGTNANVIPSGQGFFVQAGGGSSPFPQLIFNEAAKTNKQATPGVGNLFMGPPPQAAVTQYLHLKLLQDSVNADGTIICFSNNAKKNYVLGEDALYKLGNGSARLATISADSVNLAINSLPLPNQNPTMIRLKVNASQDGIYKLNLDAIKSIPELFDIWLFDAYKNDSLDIKHNPTYSFNVYESDANSYGSKRFSLVVRQNPALMVHLLNFNETKAVTGARLTWKTENEENYTNFTVERSTDGGVTYDVLGGFASNALGTYSLLDKNPLNAANQYRLKLEDLNGAISYSNVITLIYGNGDNSFAGNLNVYPNPSTDVIHLAIPFNGGLNSSSNLPVLQTIATTPGLVSTSSGSTSSYDIKIISSSGAVVKTGTSSSTNWEGSVNGLMPGTYIIQVINNANKKLVGRNTFVKL